MRELWPRPSDPLLPDVERACEELRLAERGRELDRTPEFPWKEFRALGERRLLGLTRPDRVGGRGLPPERAGALLFHLAYRAGTVFAKLALQPEFASVLLELGSPELVDRWYRPLVRGECLIGNQITEPDAGSDVRALSTRAVPERDAYVLSGVKSEAAFAVDAQAALVFAVLSRETRPGAVSAFLVPQDLPGISREVAPTDMGERWQRRGSVRYRSVRVPRSCRVGPEGKALAPLRAELTRDRALLAAIYLGVGQASLDEAVQYAGERKTFGRPLSDRQGVAFPLVEADTALHGAWLLTEETLRQPIAEDAGFGRAAMAKDVACEAALRAIDLAIQVHGGSGYSSRTPHEQRYRDVRSGRLAHGPSEVLKVTAAKALWPGAPAPEVKGGKRRAGSRRRETTGKV